MKVTFFNHFHNGDLHISRELVRKVMQKVNSIDPNVLFAYAHVNDSGLLSDIPNLPFENLHHVSMSTHDNLRNVNGAVYFNTWYGQQNYRFMNSYGMTLDCLYAAFDDTCKALFQFGLEDISSNPEDFIPTIDYSKFEIGLAKKWVEEHPQRKIFISNGQALSGQATNFSFTQIVCELAQAHPDTIFILSNQEGNANFPGNVIYSRNIIKKAGCDLNENSFLTTFCDVIVGRASGVFSYAWTQQNMLHRKTKFVCFCGPGVVIYDNNQFWTNGLLTNKIKYSAEYIVSQETDCIKVTDIINSAII